jgi:putative serine protease PepD
LIVTNAHVVNTYPEFKVSLGSEKGERDAEIVAVAPCDDLAVLRVGDTTGFATMPLGSQADLKQGQEVVTLGYPVTSAAGSDLGGALVATDGVVSIVSTPANAYSNLRFPNVIQTDAAINPGNSGGPLMNLDGELVGVNTFVSNTRQAQNFAIGVDRVKELIPRLADGTSIGWSGLGFYEPTGPDELTQLGLPEFEGLVITNAKPGTFAADAGLGDGPFLVVAINGNPVDTTLRSYCNEVGDLRRDESAVFTVFTPGSEEPQDVTVRFN